MIFNLISRGTIRLLAMGRDQMTLWVAMLNAWHIAKYLPDNLLSVMPTLLRGQLSLLLNI